MELEQARKRAEELRVIIEKNNRLYYDYTPGNISLISVSGVPPYR